MNKIALAPTTLPHSPPLEYIDAAVRAGYDGIGIRLFRSPGITYAFHPVAGNPTLMCVTATLRAGEMACRGPQWWHADTTRCWQRREVAV